MTIVAHPPWATHQPLSKQFRRLRLTQQAHRAKRKRAAFASEAIVPKDVSAVTHTLRRLNDLAASPDYVPLSRDTVLRTVQFVQAVASRGGIPPTVLPDDDGVAVLHWVSSDRSLVVEVDASGPVLLWAKDGSEPPLTLTNRWEVTEEARRLVEAYTRAASSANSQWRSFIDC